MTESLVYYHHCRENSLETAYAIQGRIPGQVVQQTAVNTFLGMKDQLYLISALSGAADVTATLKTFGAGGNEQTAVLPLQALSLGTFSLDQSTSLNTPADTNGALTLRSLQPGAFVGGVLRTRVNEDGTIDFVMPTAAQ